MESISNEFIKIFLRQRDVQATASDDGSIVCVFDKRYRVHLTPLAFDRILLWSFVSFLPAQESKKELFIQKVLKVTQANLFSTQTSLFVNQEQQSVYAQCDVFDIINVNDLESGIENFLNVLEFFRQVLKTV
ncbi:MULTISPECIES: type III secretion system chaperone [Candidatus Ichthyocystis]|uniref:type III secretion system chaperone n=1 Tax=Candidatus Ichthyocystis TaxID=2929841 RepID=UPI000B805F16|nr:MULTISPECIES: type III secretion system chaperone [Ichthyocystis]